MPPEAKPIDPTTIPPTTTTTTKGPTTAPPTTTTGPPTTTTVEPTEPPDCKILITILNEHLYRILYKLHIIYQWRFSLHFSHDKVRF